MLRVITLNHEARRAICLVLCAIKVSVFRYGRGEEGEQNVLCFLNILHKAVR